MLSATVRSVSAGRTESERYCRTSNPPVDLGRHLDEHFVPGRPASDSSGRVSKPASLCSLVHSTVRRSITRGRTRAGVGPAEANLDRAQLVDRLTIDSLERSGQPPVTPRAEVGSTRPKRVTIARSLSRMQATPDNSQTK